MWLQPREDQRGVSVWQNKVWKYICFFYKAVLEDLPSIKNLIRIERGTNPSGAQTSLHYACYY